MSNITYQIPNGFTGTTNTSDLASQYGKGNSFRVEGNQEDNTVYAFIVDDNRVDSFWGHGGNDFFSTFAYNSAYAFALFDGGEGTDYFYSLTKVDPDRLYFSRQDDYMTSFEITEEDGSILEAAVTDTAEYLTFVDSNDLTYYVLTEDIANERFRTASFDEVFFRTYGENADWFAKGLDTYTLYLNSQNSSPTDLLLSSATLNENIPPGTPIASLSAVDPDANSTFTYSLVSGTGDTDNKAFSITGNQLSIKASPDFETQSSYSLRIRTTDQGGLFFDRAVTLSINNLNEAPTALTLSASSVNENVTAGSTVATLATTDPDAANTFSYSLVSGTGDSDNNAFLINGNQLRIKASPDFESKSSYSLRIRTTDQGGLFFDRAVTLTVNDLNEAPTTTAVITGLSDNTGLIRGTVAQGGRSDDRTPTLTGTLSAPLAAGETLPIYNGKALLGTAKVNNRARTWSYTPDALPTTSGSTYSFTARVADAAGNLGRASAARTFVLDTTAPRALAFSPLDGAIAVELNANLSLSFSEAIRRGSGVIQLRTGSATGAIQERFDAATSNRLSFSGSHLTVDPSRNLLPNTRYVLTIPAGSITDRAGNRFSGSTSYDLRTIHAITGNASSNVLAFSSTVDRLTGLGGRDTFRLASLNQALLPAAVSTPIDRITDLASGIDRIDAPVARPIAQALNPVNLGAVADLRAASIAALLTPAKFPALTTSSSGGAVSFSYADPQAGPRTFLAINNAVAGFSAGTDAILEITGFSGNLNQLQVF